MMIDPHGDAASYIQVGEDRLRVLQAELQLLEDAFDNCTDPDENDEIGDRLLAKHAEITKWLTMHAAAFNAMGNKNTEVGLQ